MLQVYCKLSIIQNWQFQMDSRFQSHRLGLKRYMCSICLSPKASKAKHVTKCPFEWCLGIIGSEYFNSLSWIVVDNFLTNVLKCVYVSLFYCVYRVYYCVLLCYCMCYCVTVCVTVHSQLSIVGSLTSRHQG